MKKLQKIFNMINRICVVLLAIVMVFPFNLIPVSAASNDPYLYITSTGTVNGNFYTNAYNELYIIITLKNPTDQEVAVSYYAKDASAICEAGDYYRSMGEIVHASSIEDKVSATHAVNTVKLSKEKPSATISYNVSNTAISSNTDGKNNERFFNFVISDVVGCAMPTKTTYECHMKNTKTIGTYKDSNGYYFKEYKESWYVDHLMDDFKKKHSPKTERFNLIYDNPNNNTDIKKTNVFNNIVNTGLGNLYVRMRIYGDCNVHNVNYLRFETYADNSGATDSDDTKIGYWAVERKVYEDEKDSDILIADKYDCYVKLKKEWGDAMRVVGYSGSKTVSRWAHFKYTTYLSDDTMPTCQATYVDSSSITIDGSVRVMLRFQEPVQIKDTSKVSIIGKANGMDTIKFTYCAGNYTDTLVFEANLFNGEFKDNNVEITYIYLDSFENPNLLGDFGHNISKNMVNNYFDEDDNSTVFNSKTRPTCEIDLRIPTITSTTTYPSNYTSSRTVTLTISNFHYANLYYTWSTNKNQTFSSVDDYDSVIALVGDSKDTITKTITLDGVSGEYYLHVMVVNNFTKKNSMTIGQGGDVSKNDKGGYLLDSTNPQNQLVTVLSNKNDSKVFALSVDDGKLGTLYSGIESVFIQIKESPDSAFALTLPIYSNDNTTKLAIPSDLETGGDLCHVYQIDNTLKEVYLTNTVQSSYFAVDAGSPVSIYFSTKGKAYEYMLYNEYRDFEIFTVGTTITESIVKNHKASGELTDIATGQTWIRYKTKNFVFDNSYSEESDWVYYFYGGAGTELDIEQALKNSLLKAAVESNALYLSEQGEDVNLYDIGLINSTTGLPELPSNRIHKTATFAINRMNINFDENISYSDSALTMGKDGGEFTFKLDYNDQMIGCSDTGFVNLYIGFYTEDIAGNTNIKDITFTKYKFDMRSLFDCSELASTMPLNSDEEISNSYQTNTKFTYTANLAASESGTLEIESIKFRGETIGKGDYSKYFTIQSISNTQITLIAKQPGYLEVSVCLNEGTGSYKYHDAFTYYITNSYLDDTVNYNNSLSSKVLIGQMYELNQAYYYMDNDRNIQKVSYSTSLGYESTEDYYTYFSSLEKAKEYIRYMELQDIKAVKIDDSIAVSLNSGTESMFMKAPGEEKTTAVSGQIWVRYKITSWTKDSNENAWVYYCLKTSYDGTIQTNKLGDILTPALDSVVSTIASSLKLVNLIGGQYTDEYGSPKVEEYALHYKDETTNVTKTGSSFSSTNSYTGDEDVFSGTVSVTINGISEEIAIQTNSKITTSQESRIFYCYYSGQLTSDYVFHEAKISEGMTYREATNGASGTYFIREYSLKGVREYKVYIDSMAPAITIIYTLPNATDSYSRVLDSSKNGTTIGATTFTISEISTVLELDPYAYVVVMDNYGIIEENGVHFVKDLQTQSFKLSNGSHQIFVSDRSGNAFTFAVNCSDEALKFNVSTSENQDCVEVSINRDPEEIQLYQVYLNGSDTPLDGVWNGSRKKTEKYKESGYYYIYVKDIYGNEQSEKGEGSGYSFERPLPDITWSYLADEKSQTYLPYSDDCTTMTLYKSLGTTYYISTSKPLKFKMKDNYKYSITGISEGKLEKFNLGKDVLVGSVDDWVNNKTLQDFTITFWYEEYPDIQVTYVVSTDTEAPEINVTYTSNCWVNSEEITINNQLANLSVGDVFDVSTLSYQSNKVINQYVANYSTIYSKLIRLDAEDVSGITSLLIYLTEPGKSEELYMDVDTEGGNVKNLTLSRAGTYRIVASDVFYNSTEFTFTNFNIENIEYSVDDNEAETRATSPFYGNSNATVKMLTNGIISIMVSEDGYTKVIFINVENGTATLQEYKVVMAVDEEDSTYSYKSCELCDVITQEIVGTRIVEQVRELFSLDDPAFNTANHFYQVLSKYDEKGNIKDGINLYISYDLNDFLSFRVECDEKDVDVTFRCSFDYSFEPYLVKAKLSKAVSDVVVKNKTSQDIINIEPISYINKAFVLDDNFDSLITKIEFGYSENNQFDELITIYPYEKISDIDPNNYKPFDTDQNGFYKIQITNIYGNVNTYLINKSDVFTVVEAVQYADGTYQKLPTSHQFIVKSNGTYFVEAYSVDVEFRIIKNSITTYISSGTDKGSYRELTLTEPGTYEIEVVDLKYGNTTTVYADIQNTSLVFADQMVTGYNIKAMKKYYSSTLLSVVSSEMNNVNVKYIAIRYNDETYVLVDVLNKDAEMDVSKLDYCIGSLGDGVYTLVCRDSYGAKFEKQFYYNGSSGLLLNRRITSSKEEQKLELTNDLITNGAWSNAAFIFDTIATTYEFYVDGVNTQLPKTLELVSGNGTIPYDIYYRDEYGNEYSFKATIQRQNVSLNLDPEIKATTISDILTTSDPIIMRFSLGNCTYTLDNGPVTKYAEDTVLYKDGKYRFTVEDKAGNQSTLTVVIDTKVEFSFVDKSTGGVLIDGEAVNTKLVRLESTENVHINKIYLNGEKITLEDNVTFKEHGQYYVFLEDEIGNQAVFEFTLITHNVNQMYYETPESYFITALWFSGKDGTFSSYMNTGAVTHNSNNSSMLVNESGDYQVTMTSELYKKGLTFTFTVDTSKPKVSLVGATEGEKTLEDVTLDGCEQGDTIYIYKDDVLVNTYVLDSLSAEAPTITEGGHYRIVIENLAGNTTEFAFQKTRVLNTAGSVLMIIIFLAVIAGIMTGVVLRNKQKFDD